MLVAEPFFPSPDPIRRKVIRATLHPRTGSSCDDGRRRFICCGRPGPLDSCIAQAPAFFQGSSARRCRTPAGSCTRRIPHTVWSAPVVAVVAPAAAAAHTVAAPVAGVVAVAVAAAVAVCAPVAVAASVAPAVPVAIGVAAVVRAAFREEASLQPTWPATLRASSASPSRRRPMRREAFSATPPPPPPAPPPPLQQVSGLPPGSAVPPSSTGRRTCIIGRVIRIYENARPNPTGVTVRQAWAKVATGIGSEPDRHGTHHSHSSLERPFPSHDPADRASGRTWTNPIADIRKKATPLKTQTASTRPSLRRDGLPQ